MTDEGRGCAYAGKAPRYTVASPRTIVDDLRQQLIARARDVAARAYAPYSRFRVGAALRDALGQIYVGCNVESVSYGLTICAERNAIFAAVAAGASRPFSALAVTCLDALAPCMPCGACLQIIQEHLAADAPVYVGGGSGHSFTVAQLLPHPFQMDPGAL